MGCRCEEKTELADELRERDERITILETHDLLHAQQIEQLQAACVILQQWKTPDNIEAKYNDAMLQLNAVRASMAKMQKAIDGLKDDNEELTNSLDYIDKEVKDIKSYTSLEDQIDDCDCEPCIHQKNLREQAE